MPSLREAATQALEALEIMQPEVQMGEGDAAITALRAALEQPEQEPVACIRTWHKKNGDQHAELWDWCDGIGSLPEGEHLLFTRPPRREPEQEPKWRLSCGCPSHYGGIPAEWPETDREGNPAVAYGVVCERHWHEYGARNPSEQEPVAYLYHDASTPQDAHPWLHSTMLVLAADRRSSLRGETPLFTHPPRREWRGLTNEEVDQMAGNTVDAWECARAIEAMLKERNA